MQQLVQGAVAHKLRHNAEELGLVADAKDLEDGIEAGFVEDLGLLQQTLSLSGTRTHTNEPPQSIQSILEVPLGLGKLPETTFFFFFFFNPD